MPTPRPDRNGSHQTQFRINKKKIYATQTVCGICGKPVDFSLKYPHPLSACIDHIIPIAKGGHPSALENLQLAHWCCNRQKSDKLVENRCLIKRLKPYPTVFYRKLLIGSRFKHEFPRNFQFFEHMGAYHPLEGVFHVHAFIV